ncbi:response regulator transcription factor [Neobacillus vireti]|uniref:response regulator transcription factor n=1 Tax=Neobacillus vireti TaxID=220686 RepID=UPI0030004A17
MFNLLIVDDEPWIVEGLASLDWGKLNIQNVYKETSGQKALQVMKENQIDIVITDIRMPDMTGIELIASASKGRVRKYIILSGYAEFEYAKQAIQLSVCDYLLKPVPDEEIMEAVSKAIHSIQNDQRSFEELMKSMSLIGDGPFLSTLDFLYEKPQLIELMEYGNWDVAEKKIRDIFTQLGENVHYSHEFTLQVYFMICNTFTYFTHKHGYLLTDIIRSEFHSMYQRGSKHSIQELQEITLATFLKIKTNINKEKDTNHFTVIEQVNHYIDSHLHKDIFLQEVANHVYLHPTYLSKLYREKTGKTFSDCVYSRKMEKAAAHLKESNEKIYKIAEGVGYKDSSYFIKKFKDYHGVTPQEYRFHTYPNIR